MAPTIESAFAANILTDRLMDNWNKNIGAFSPENHAVIASNCTFNNYLVKYKLDNNAAVNRKTKGFGTICTYKGGRYYESGIF